VVVVTAPGWAEFFEVRGGSVQTRRGKGGIKGRRRRPQAADALRLDGMWGGHEGQMSTLWFVWTPAESSTRSGPGVVLAVGTSGDRFGRHLRSRLKAQAEYLVVDALEVAPDRPAWTHHSRRRSPLTRGPLTGPWIILRCVRGTFPRNGRRRRSGWLRLALSRSRGVRTIGRGTDLRTRNCS